MCQQAEAVEVYIDRLVSIVPAKCSFSLMTAISRVDYVECAGQGKRDCSISSVLSGLIELSELEVGVKVDDNRIT